MILSTGWFPEIWVNSVLVPLFKKGLVEDIVNVSRREVIHFSTKHETYELV
jgi:hypothetical protein